MSAVLVEAAGIERSFGGVRALDGIDLDVGQGETVGLIGPNGSGKTTLLNVLSGVIPPTGGSLRIDGEPVPFVAAHHAARRYGFARTFQSIRLCSSLTVLENVLIGAHKGFRPLDALGWSRRETEARRHAMAVLERVGVDRLADERATELSYGDQRRVEIARALATVPRLLMLDEPAAGMNPTEAAQLVGLIRGLGDSDLALIVIEHNMAVIMNTARRVFVLDAGRRIASGTPEQVANDPAVQKAYLGSRRRG
jgi:ABC-type branched-subunit amino acid transport system ATPase component